MAVFTNTFTTGPQGTDLASNLDVAVRDETKNALEERYAQEHISLRSAEAGATTLGEANAQGRHKAGIVGCLGSGTTAAKNALSGMGTGAIFFDTDENALYRYEIGTGWVLVEIGGTSQNLAVKSDYVKGIAYTNDQASGRKLLIVAFCKGQYLLDLEGYIGASSPTIQVARFYADSEGVAPAWGTISFVVPFGWKFQVDISGSGTISSIRIESWEI